MNSVLRIFLSLASQFEVLFGCFLLVTGIVVGVFLGRRFRKTVPQNLEEMADAIVSLETEMKNTDAAVALLWATRFRPDSRGVSRGAIKAQHSSAINSLAIRVINIKNTVESLRDNIQSVLPWLDNKQDSRRFEPKSSEGNAKIPTIGRTRELTESDLRDPNQNKSTLEVPVTALNVLPANSSLGAELGSQSRTRNSLQAADILSEIVELYNRAVDDPLARERFREDYPPVRIGTVNAVERRQNPTIKAEIRATTDGDFFAFPLPREDEYAVFPRLGLTIEAVSYGAGAIGEVFGKTQGHDSKLFYSRYRVKEPAIFQLEFDSWILRKPGELELGVGE